MTDYDIEFVYHEGRAYLVADASSKKSSHTLAALDGIEELNRDFARLNLEVIRKGELQHFLGDLAIQPSFFKEIQSSHNKDLKLVKLKEEAREGKAKGFFIYARIDSVGRWENRL